MPENEYSGKEGFVKIPNPYSASDVQSGKSFYHEDLIKKIKKEFEKKPPGRIFLIRGFIGSGKTSTLRRMVLEPQILGQRYIPIYINANDIEAVNTDAFFIFIYKTIKDALTKLNYRVDEPNYSFRPGISLDEMKIFTHSIEENLDNKTVIISIIDDFEEIYRRFDPVMINNIFTFFNHILNERHMFRLILAGKGDILKLAEGVDLSFLSESVFEIELGMFLEEEKIENLVVKPVKDRVKFEPEAVQEVVRISGRNLYCQQLLCYYLIEHLNEKRQKICTKNDVHQVTHKAITDAREDFKYFWEHLPYKSKIVDAALADKSVIKKEGQFYFLRESTLLDFIFNKKNLDEILKRLHSDQHINKIEGRRFRSYPFRIPLYGEWVKNSHPLLRTVVENWKKITGHLSLSSLENIIRAIPEEMLPLDREAVNTAINISQKWSAVKSGLRHIIIDINQVTELVRDICDIFGFKIIKEPDDREKFFRINIKRLNLGSLENVLLFTIPREGLTDDDTRYIQEEILHEDKASNPSFILCFKKTPKILELSQKQFLGIILIEEDHLKKCVLSSTPLRVFRKDIVIRQIKLSAISPYKTAGPVSVTFYGRQDEIGRVLGKKDSNFAIVGARKIGKTSLLKKIITEIPITTQPIYLDLEAENNYKSFLFSLANKIEEKYDKKVSFVSNLSNLPEIIIQLSRTGKKPVFLFDEFDNLLEVDKKNKYKLLAKFRALAQEEYCQVIISGFRELYFAKMDIKSPLYNFLEFLTLEELRKNNANALISEPMKSIGIEYNNEEDKKIILQHTSCHPNLLQFSCKSLVERIQEKAEKRGNRKIFKKDIDELYESFDYEKYVINEFYMFFTDVDAIERLIILLLLNKYPESDIFTFTEVNELLKANGFNFMTGELTGYLASLSLRYIFSAESGGRFRFALPIFPKILKDRYNLRNLIKEAKEDAKKSI